MEKNSEELRAELADTKRGLHFYIELDKKNLAERDHLRAVNAELLEALENATGKIQMYHETRTGFADDARQVRKLRELIARARG